MTIIVRQNTLVKQPKYDNICFFDSDDVMLPNFINNLINFDKNTYVIVRGIDFINTNETKFGSKTHIYPGSIIIDKNVFVSLNGFENWRCAADTDLIMRLDMKNIKRTESTEVTFLRRLHDNNLTESTLYGRSSKYRLDKKKIIKERNEAKIQHYSVSSFKIIYKNTNKKFVLFTMLSTGRFM